MFIQELLQLQEAAKAAKHYRVTVERSGKSSTYADGTLEELIDYFGYTLETGRSYQNEKGNKKINLKPSSIADLVKNLNNAVDNAARDGNGGKTFSFKEVTAPAVSESVEELTEKVFDEDKYTWYVWTQRKPSQAFERRGGAKSLEKGMQFGLRPATSKKGTWRLIIKQNGPSIIFSIDDTTAKAVAKASLELK